MKTRLFVCVLSLGFVINGLAQKMTVKDNSSNVLMEVNDEGTTGSITLPSGSAPGDVTGKLYVVDGNLYWSGSDLSSGFALPYSGSTSSSVDAFEVTQTGTGPAGRFDINNSDNNNAALELETDGSGLAIEASCNGTGGVAYFMIDDDGNSSDVLEASTNGTGRSGYFVISNSENSNAALHATTNGIGPSIYGYQNSSGPAGKFELGSSSNSFAVYAITQGSSGTAGLFYNDNSSNSGRALYARTDGPGQAFVANHYGPSGNIAEFQDGGITQSFIDKSGMGSFSVLELPAGSTPSTTTNKLYNVSGTLYWDGDDLSSGLSLPYSGSTSSSSDAFFVTTTGTGRAGRFRIDNAGNSMAALSVSTNGTGYGIHSETFGSSNAGYFRIQNISNSTTALFGQTDGSGNAIKGYTSGTGRAGFFELNNASNSAAALEVSTNGLGYGLYVTHTGAEDGIRVDISGGGSNRCAILAASDRIDPTIAGIKTGVTGEGGLFEIDNTSNTGNALAGITNGTGAALRVDHYGSSGDIALFQNDHGTVASINKNGDAWFDGGMEVDGLNGTSSYNNVRVNTSNGQFYYETSSARYKDHIGVLNDDFSRILELKPKKYTDKASGLREIGYIAEELDALGLKDLVIYNDEDQPNGLKYDRISLYLIEVLKQYRDEIELLKKKVEMIN